MKKNTKSSNKNQLVGNINLKEISKKAEDESQRQIKATAIHIDTVKLRHSLAPNDVPSVESLYENGFEVNEKLDKNGFKLRTLTYKPSEKYKTPYLQIVSSEGGYCFITVTCSIAKLIDGNGIGLQSDQDVAFALSEITRLVNEKTKSRFDAATAIVSMLDVNADFAVGEEQIRNYVNSVSQPTRRLKPAKFGETTIAFSNKSRKIEIYGKYQQMEKLFHKGRVSLDDVEAAKGLLRIEVRLMKPSLRRLKNTLRTELLAENLLKMSVAEDVLKKHIRLLNLHNHKPSNANFDKHLLSAFGKDTPKMYGFLYYRNLYGEDVLKQLGWSKSTYDRVKRKLIKANLWDNLQSESLPALLIQ